MTCDTDGVVHVEASEVEMLRDVAARVTSRAETSTDKSDWTPYGRSLGGGISYGPTTDTAAEGILDFGGVAGAHQMLPWGSQYRNVVSREGHAWVLADPTRAPQVAAAAELAEGMSSAMAVGSRADYSDACVLGRLGHCGRR